MSPRICHVRSRFVTFWFGLAALFFGEPSLAQTASDAPASAPKRLDDEDAKQVEALQKSIEQLRRAVKFPEAAAPRGEPRKSLNGKPQSTATGFDHPYYWAGFILIGDPG